MVKRRIVSAKPGWGGKVYNGKRIREAFNLTDVAREIIGNYELRGKKREKRTVLRNGLRTTFIKLFTVRTIAEQQCLQLAEASTRLGHVLGSHDLKKIPLTEGRALYEAASTILKICTGKKDLDAPARQLATIAKESGTTGCLEINARKFSALLAMGNSKIRDIMNGGGVSDYAKIGFREINKVVNEAFKEAEQ